MKAVVEIFKTYTTNEIVEAVKNSRNLDAVTHNFCSNYFNIPKHQMNAPSQYRDETPELMAPFPSWDKIKNRLIEEVNNFDFHA